MKFNVLYTIVYANLRNYIRGSVYSLLIPITLFLLMQLIYSFITSQFHVNSMASLMPGSGMTSYVRLDTGKDISIHDYTYSVGMLIILFQASLMSVQQTILKIRSSGYLKYMFIGNVSNNTFIFGFFLYGIILAGLIFTAIQLVFAPFILPYFRYSFYLLVTLISYAGLLTMMALFCALIINSQIVMGFINAFVNLFLMFTSGFFIGKEKFSSIPIINNLFEYNPLYHLVLQFRSFYFGFYQDNWLTSILFAGGVALILWVLCLLRLRFGRQAVILNAI